LALIGAEIYKQYLAFNPTYDANCAPLFISSQPYLWCSLACFSKPNTRISSLSWATALCVTLAISLGVIILPGLIIGQDSAGIFKFLPTDNFATYHGFMYHMGIICFTVFCFCLKPYRADKRDIKWVFVLFGAYLLVTAIMTWKLNQDYAMFIEFPLNIKRPFLKTAFVYAIYMAGLCGTSVLIVIGVPLFLQRLKCEKRLPHGLW
jgi:hypothetical protein